MTTMALNLFDKLMESLIDSIMAFNEFVVKKHVTLSELTMFLFSLGWTIYFLLGGHISEEALPWSVWIALFTVITLSHVVAFTFEDIGVRAVLATVVAIVWLVLAVISGYTGATHPAVPTLATFTFLSLMIAIRLFRARQQQ